MATPVEQIKDKLSITDVVGSYLKLEKAGANFKAKCPFHNEKTASFFVSPDRGSYYCFGCGAKGDIFSFVQQFEGLDFVGALRVLAERAGVELRRRDAGQENRERTERERLYLLQEYATLFYQRQLSGRTTALDYLHKRGLKDSTIKEWRIGYAPAEWQALSDYVKSKNFTDREVETGGLAKKSEKGSGIYDRFRGRVMFPIFDVAGRIVAFSGRQLESDGTEAKYINSPETPLFQKSRILYGWHRARLEIRKTGRAILVEGQMDLLACHQAGLTNTVATSGTALTPEHVTLIKRLADKLVICYDADTAGQNAAAKGFALALAAGLEVTVATFPAGQDPADIAKDDPAQLVTFIQSARHIIDVELERILAAKQPSRDRDRAIERTLLPYIAVLESQIERSRFITAIAHATGIKEQILWDEVRKVAARTPVSTSNSENTFITSPKKQAESRFNHLNRLVWGLVFLDDKNAQGLDIRQKISTIMGVSAYTAAEQEAATIRDELLFEAEVAFTSGGAIGSLERVSSELLNDFEEEWLREELATATRTGQSQDTLNKLLLRLRTVHQKQQ